MPLSLCYTTSAAGHKYQTLSRVMCTSKFVLTPRPTNTARRYNTLIGRYYSVYSLSVSNFFFCVLNLTEFLSIIAKLY